MGQEKFGVQQPGLSERQMFHPELSDQDVEGDLYAILNERMEGTSPGFYDGEPLPKVAPAPPFRSYPNVVGGKNLQGAVKGLLNYAPELRGRVRNVGHPPDWGVMTTMDEGKIPIERFSDTNLLGQHDRRDRSIYINPNLDQDPWNLKTVLAHEYGHATGLDEPDAETTQDIWKDRHPRGDIELPPDPIQGLLKALKAAGIQFEVQK